MSRFPVIASRAALLAISVLLAAEPAHADNTADEANLRFKRGVEAYRARRYEDALGEFFQSNRLVKNRNVLLNIARCYEQLRMLDEAYRYYDDVLAEDPDESDRRAVEASLARIAPRVALLEIVSDPPGADIFIDRRDLGSRGLTPKTLALPPGKSSVILALPGHREAIRVATLATGRRGRLEVPLEVIHGQVRVEGGPEGAEVRVDRTDGAPATSIPGVLQLAPGRHLLNVSAPGFVAAQIPVELAAEQQLAITATLQPLPVPTGTVVVTANHDGALVEVDGKESGFTPAVLELPVSPHRVAVTMADMSPFERQVEVGDGTRTSVRAALRFAGAKTTAASKTETSIDEAPASITVISRDEILAFGYTSLPEALRGVRGLFFSDDRNYESIGVRGFAPPGDLNNRVLVLFDGHPMNDIFAGQAYLGRENNIDLNEVDRIELVRGPVSSLFGSAAFFGVINIVPRHHLGERTAELSASAGSQGLGRLRASAGGKQEWGEYMLTLGGMRASGEEMFTMRGGTGAGDVLVRDRDGETAFNGSARARLGEFTLLGSINTRTKQVPTGAYETSLDLPGTSTRDQRAFLEARWERSPDSGATVAARAYYDATRFRGRYVYEEGDQVDTGAADWVGAELRYRTRERWNQHLTVGLEYQGQLSVRQGVVTEGAVGLDDERTFHIASAYLADELRLGRALLVNGSVRADEYLGSFGLTVNPRLALISFLVPGGATKLMGGRSFRAPTVYERFYQDGAIDPISGLMVYKTAKPNEELQPEVILTGELEHAQELGGNFRLTGSVYVNQITDLIVAMTDPLDGISYAGNAGGTVRTEGAELELRWQPARLTVLSVAYWVQRMLVEGLDDPEEQARLRSNAPAHAFSVRAMFPIEAPLIIGSVEALYNSSRLLRDGSGSTGEVLWLNAGLSGTLPRGGFRYFAGVRNLLDERPQLPASADVRGLTLPGYGRTFLVQVATDY